MRFTLRPISSKRRHSQSWLEPLTSRIVSGWIWIPSSDTDTVDVDIFEGGRLIGSTTADQFRPDLAKAGVGTGKHAFRFELPDSLLDGLEREIAVKISGTNDSLRNSPQRYTVPLEVTVDGLEHNLLTGWAWNPWNPDAHLDIELWEGDCIVGRGIANVARADLTASHKGKGDHGFRLPLPEELLDGEEHLVRVTIAGARHAKLPAASKRIRAAAKGYLDCIDLARNVVVGWAWDPMHRHGSAQVEIKLNDRCIGTVAASGFRGDLRDLGLTSCHIGFEFPLPEPLDPYKSYVISASIVGTATPLNNSPQFYVSPEAVQRTVKELQCELNARCQGANGKAPATPGTSALDDDLGSCEYIRQFIFPSMLNALPDGATHLQINACAPPLPSPDASFDSDVSSRTVDVIVPVYQAVAATVQCLTSIAHAAADASSLCEVTVIIDDPDRQAYGPVLELARKSGFSLLFNDQNDGFVKTVNRGMRLHPERDVILLNSDTLVHGDWVGRLREAAYRDASIGTVTPLSNNATICSYPRMCSAEAIQPEQVAVLDRLCAATNSGETAEIPTAVGFCMYIRRKCLRDVGLFDEQLWGKGYGEENEFCLRATARGWRHIVAGGIFVGHLGHASFDAEQSCELMRENGAKLSRLYPGYDRTVAAFIHADPVRRIRRRLDLERLRQGDESYVVFITADLIGGAGRHVNDMVQALTRQGVPVAVLRVTAERQARIEAGLHAFPNLVYNLDRECDQLCADLRSLRVRHIHYQQMLNVPEKILRLASDLHIPYDCTIHDYACLCPRVSMVDDSGVYCGEPDVAVCEKCLKLCGAHPMWSTFAQQYRTVAALRASSAQLLAGARRVFCPDEDVRERLARYFKPDNLLMRPHPDAVPETAPLPLRESRRELRVAVIGAVGPYKGYEVLLACARRAFKMGVPIRFIVIGYTCDDKELAAVGNVSITGKYAEEKIFELLRKEHPDLAFFPSVCPETYSYTLSIALRAGLYPVAFDLGAIGRRIRAVKFGKVLPLTLQPMAILEALDEAAREAPGSTPPGREAVMVYDDIIREYYEMPAIAAGMGA